MAAGEADRQIEADRVRALADEHARRAGIAGQMARNFEAAARSDTRLAQTLIELESLEIARLADLAYITQRSLTDIGLAAGEMRAIAAFATPFVPRATVFGVTLRSEAATVTDIAKLGIRLTQQQVTRVRNAVEVLFPASRSSGGPLSDDTASIDVDTRTRPAIDAWQQTTEITIPGARAREGLWVGVAWARASTIGAVALIPAAPTARTVMSSDGLALATYDFSERAESPLPADAPVVLAVHGFASSAVANWQATGWVRELGRAGYRVIGLDQRGHGHSAKPHDPGMYTMEALVDDVATVIDTYLIDELTFIGYSLGGRVGWHAALELPHRITRAVLGGIPDGLPLTRFRLDQARAFIASGTAVEDRLTGAYLTMAGSLKGNDLSALVSLVEGMREGTQPDIANPPTQPILFATGSDDTILERSRGMAEAAPGGTFYEIPDRNHFNAPTSKHLRDRALEFLAASS